MGCELGGLRRRRESGSEGLRCRREGRGGGRRRQGCGGEGSDTQAVLWGRGAHSGRGQAGLAGSPRSPADLWGIGSICISLGGFYKLLSGITVFLLVDAFGFTS